MLRAVQQRHAYVSRTEKLDELIARMYVHGMSTRDIEATFADVLSGTGVSKSVVSRVTRCLSEDFEAFRKRDLSNEKLLYLELDGKHSMAEAPRKIKT